MLTRREFLKLCAAGASVSLVSVLLPDLALAAKSGAIDKLPVIWIELGSCTGDSISLANTMDPSQKKLFSEIIDLRYHWLHMAAQDGQSVKALEDTVQRDKNRYILVIEGSVVTADQGKYNYILQKNGSLKTGIDMLKYLAEHARWVMPVGSCATWGGPAAAYPNPAGCKGVAEVIHRPVINVPGCPAHPDWTVGTLYHLINYGEPELDSAYRPKIFFGRTVHDRCTRRQYFENGIFARNPGEESCMYLLGCKGPVTYADCPVRQWNDHVNWPVEASSPCIGCTSPEFPDGMMPYFKHLPDIRLHGATAAPDRLAKALGIGTAVGLGTHLAGNIFTGRIGKNLISGTKPKASIVTKKTYPAKELEDKVDALLEKFDNLEQELTHARQKSRNKKGLIAKAKQLLGKDSGEETD
ncbi:MAG: hydrogenase small subunit [Thermoanaerobacteraceae bacterium]|nr:hydrogenase small subunit [Thermoanaerobacteraceae bacterium]